MSSRKQVLVLTLEAEKFMDIKCQSAGLAPSAVVIVATVRALKYHGGADPKTLTIPDTGALSKGLENLTKHLENVAQFGVPAVVAINIFTTDTDHEIRLIEAHCRNMGVEAIRSDVWAQGGGGAEALAEQVCALADSNDKTFTPMYTWDMPVKDKIRSSSN